MTATISKADPLPESLGGILEGRKHKTLVKTQRFVLSLMHTYALVRRCIRASQVYQVNHSCLCYNLHIYARHRNISIHA